jgi:hypothetical protein
MFSLGLERLLQNCFFFFQATHAASVPELKKIKILAITFLLN